MSTTALLLAPIIVPLLMAGVYAAVGWRPVTAWPAVGGAAAVVADAAILATVVTRDGPVQAYGLIRADALSVWLLLVVASVTLLASWASPAYLAAAHTTPTQARWYGVLLQLFVAAMSLAVLASNLGVLWVAIEATTIVTAFLVGHHRTRTALEAAWKYVVICSAAIAIAFLGTVLLYYAARNGGLAAGPSLDWVTLTGHADQLDPAVTRIAVGLAVLGFGAKAGLIPLHAWLPDAHSQAPAPVSALMSGVLLAVAFYAVLRFKAVADAALGPTYLRTLLLILALATLAVAAIMLISQQDYKRMLAYSSMEHMGIIAVGAAIGTRFAVAAILLHIAGHGVAKTVAFLASGHILHQEGSTTIADVRGLGIRAPVLAGVFAAAILGLLGFPPAAIFASELGLVRAATAAGMGWVVAVAGILMLVAFAAIASRTAKMLLGSPMSTIESTGSPPSVAALGAGTATPMVAGLAVLVALGISIWPVADLLTAAATIIGAP